MNFHNTFIQMLNGFLVLVAVFPIGKINRSTTTSKAPVQNHPMEINSGQINVLNNQPQHQMASKVPYDDLSITGISNGFFEAGSTGWVEYSSNGWDLIINSGYPSGVTPHSGSWMAWLGGDDNETGYIQQQITVPVGSPFLSYWHWISSADQCGYDKAIININHVALEEYNLCSTASTGGWVEHTVDLSSYAGQSVAFQIGVETDGSTNSNLFIDDVSLSLSYIYLPLLINQ